MLKSLQVKERDKVINYESSHDICVFPIVAKTLEVSSNNIDNINS